MQATRTHPIASFACRVNARLDELAGLDALYTSVGEKKAALLDLERARHRLAGLQAQIMAGAGEVTEDGAHRTVADFLSSQASADRGPLVALEKLGQALDERFAVLAAAVADGRVSIPKAQVLIKALDLLRSEEDVTTEVLASAEAHLVSMAPDFTTAQLRILARRVLDVVAPQIAEAVEARGLEHEEQNAARHLSVAFLPRAGGIPGVTEIRIRTSEVIAARLRTNLEALTAPRHLANVGVGRAVSTEDRRPYGQRMGAAFNTLIETLDPDRLPIHGGNATTIMVTIPLADLRKDLAAASVHGSSEGELRISAGHARRLACNAMIIPAVLGGSSEILDLGRARRLFTPAQRKAMAARDKTCRAEGCTMPAPWCEAHHFDTPWSRGGLTNLKHGKLLCPWHHQRAHDNRYQLDELPNGDVRYTRRR